MRTRYRKILVAAVLSALASMAILASAAEAATPAPPYEDFAGCPSRAENEFVASCIKYTFSGGKIGIGKREIPITNPIVLRGGFEQETGEFLNNGEGGMIPAKQTVPGGLIGLTGFPWLDELLGSKEQLKLYATVELAGAPGNVSEPPFTLPVKIHLENPALGSSCYVGSVASPINLSLITHTTSPPPPNSPITGKPAGKLVAEAGRPEVKTTSATGEYVDNAYAVPGASGCQLKIGPFTLPIDELVDAAYALPSAAGHNTTILDYGFSVVDPEVVYP
jgi:hypothetical protein